MATTNNEQAPRQKRQVPPESQEHFRRAREEMWHAVDNLLPTGFVEHRRAAQREMLLAWRSLIDAAIQRMDQKR